MTEENKVKVLSLIETQSFEANDLRHYNLDSQPYVELFKLMDIPASQVINALSHLCVWRITRKNNFFDFCVPGSFFVTLGDVVTYLSEMHERLAYEKITFIIKLLRNDTCYVHHEFTLKAKDHF